MKSQDTSIVLLLVFCVLELVSSISYFWGIHLVFICWLIYSLIAYGDNAIHIFSNLKYKLLLGFYIFYFFSNLFSSGFELAFARTIALLEIFSPVLMYDFYKINRWNNAKYPIWILISVVILNMSLSFSMIEFMGKSGLRDTIQADSENIFKGALAIVTSIAILVPTAFYILLHPDRISPKYKYLKIVFLIIFIFYGILLLCRALFMTSILTAVIGCAIAIIYGTRRWIMKGCICIALISLGFIAYFDEIVDYSDSFGVSSQLFITPKLYEIKYVLEGQSSNAVDISSRNSLAESSFNTFKDNPIFGITHKATDFEETAELGVGNHSEWLDDLALYGIFAVLIFAFLYIAAKEQIRQSKYSLSLILFVFLGFNNPILNFQVIFTVYLLIPIFLEYIKKNYFYVGNRSRCI